MVGGRKGPKARGARFPPVAVRVRNAGWFKNEHKETRRQAQEHKPSTPPGPGPAEACIGQPRVPPAPAPHRPGKAEPASAAAGGSASDQRCGAVSAPSRAGPGTFLRVGPGGGWSGRTGPVGALGALVVSRLDEGQLLKWRRGDTDWPCPRRGETGLPARPGERGGQGRPVRFGPVPELRLAAPAPRWNGSVVLLAGFWALLQGFGAIPCASWQLLCQAPSCACREFVWYFMPHVPAGYLLGSQQHQPLTGVVPYEAANNCMEFMVSHNVLQ